MGICINLVISTSVTRKEWADVYQETLTLLKAFPLATYDDATVRGIETRCLVRTAEREQAYGWRRSTFVGWVANADYETLGMAESYPLPRDLIEDERYVADAPDALYMAHLIYDEEYEWDTDGTDRYYRLWGNSTQGEPYHMYLLAIGCLIESRLGRKACVYGSITKDQCERAVRMANEHLARPIETPDRCDMDRLLARVRSMPITEAARLRLFAGSYLGSSDGSLGSHIRSHFTEDTTDLYWEHRFRTCRIASIGFADDVREYLEWGFDLERMCDLVDFAGNADQDPYVNFINFIMDTKIHLSDRKREELLGGDGQPKEPDSLEALERLLMRFIMVDRHIPLDKIRASLRRAIGDRCPTDALIDAYLEKEQAQRSGPSNKSSDEEHGRPAAKDPSRVPDETLGTQGQASWQEEGEYDCERIACLPLYKRGDTLSPTIAEICAGFYAVSRSLTDEDLYQDLMREAPELRCRWLAQSHQGMILRDRDWERIFDDIFDNPDSFARYYLMARVLVDTRDKHEVVRALVTNDDLWQHVARA